MWDTYTVKNLLDNIYGLDTLTVSTINGIVGSCRNALQDIIKIIGEDLTENVVED